MGIVADVICLTVVFILYARGQIQAIPIDPQHPDVILTTHTHCLATNKPILLKDPFNPALAQDANFLLMSWDRYRKLPSGEETEEGPLYEFADGSPVITSDKYVAYENWGLQVNDVTLEDSARYKATVILTTDREEKIISIVVAKPPTLESEKLGVTRVVNADNQTVTLSCGRIADLGQPPVSIRWKADNGTVLPAEYRNGYLVLTMSSKEETGKYTCDIDQAAPAAECIPEEDKPRWEGSVIIASTASSGDNLGLIIGIAVAVLILLVIIIILIVLIIKRKGNGNSYNARKEAQEKQKEGERGDEAKTRLMDDSNPYDRPSAASGAPIYKGPTPPSPYMVSPISQGQRAPVVATEDDDIDIGRSAPSANSGKFLKKGEKKKEEKDSKTGSADDEPKPPKTKPRSIFLTESMEDLNKINTAVKGGEGSGAPGTAV